MPAPSHAGWPSSCCRRSEANPRHQAVNQSRCCSPRSQARRAIEASMIALTWEDWEYRIDPSIVPLARLKKVRAMQAGNSLDAVLRLWQAAALLPVSRAAESSRGAADADALEQVRRAATSIRPLMETHSRTQSADGWTRNDGPTSKRRSRKLSRRSTRFAKRGHLTRVPDLCAASDEGCRCADGRRAPVAASTLCTSEIPTARSGCRAMWPFVTTSACRIATTSTPTCCRGGFLSSSSARRGTSRGSLLGLDIGLARLRLPQVASGGPPAPPVMAPEDQRVFIESVALFGPAHGGDEAMHARRRRDSRRAASG